MGDGWVPYLINRFERSEGIPLILVAHMRFKNAVHCAEGDEKEKVAAAKMLFKSKSCFQCGAAKKNKLLRCGSCKRVYFCNKQCQTDGWAAHKKGCKQTRERHAKGDYSQDKLFVGELLSVAMRGGGVEGVFGTILSYV